MDCLLDPFLIALPSEDSDANRFENYIEELYRWTAEVRKKNHKFWLSWWIFDALEKTKQYPNWNNVQVIKKQHPQVFSAYDVFRACERELLEPFFIDEVCKNEDLYYESASAIVLPEEIEERLKSNVAQALRETLVYIGIAKRICEEPVVLGLLFASIPVKSGNNLVTLKIRANDFSKEGAEVEIDTEWPLITSMEQLDGFEGLKSFWQDTQRAVDWAYKQLCTEGKLRPAETFCPQIIRGKNFNSSIKTMHFENRIDVLSAIFRVAVLATTGKLPKNTKPHKPLRVGDEADSEQVIRQSDGATAWRVWVTKGAQAIRLHYWLTPDNQVELSNAVPKRICQMD